MSLRLCAPEAKPPETKYLVSGPPAASCTETVPGFSVSVPMQMNQCDCGVYVLHYAEMFARQCRSISIDDEFIATKGANVMGEGWFEVLDIVAKRVAIVQDVRRFMEQEA